MITDPCSISDGILSVFSWSSSNPHYFVLLILTQQMYLPDSIHWMCSYQVTSCSWILSFAFYSTKHCQTFTLITWSLRMSSNIC
jgi:hypothetical protein